MVAPVDDDHSVNFPRGDGVPNTTCHYQLAPDDFPLPSICITLFEQIRWLCLSHLPTPVWVLYWPAPTPVPIPPAIADVPRQEEEEAEAAETIMGSLPSVPQSPIVVDLSPPPASSYGFMTPTTNRLVKPRVHGSCRRNLAANFFDAANQEAITPPRTARRISAIFPHADDIHFAGCTNIEFPNWEADPTIVAHIRARLCSKDRNVFLILMKPATRHYYIVLTEPHYRSVFNVVRVFDDNSQCFFARIEKAGDPIYQPYYAYQKLRSLAQPPNLLLIPNSDFAFLIPGLERDIVKKLVIEMDSRRLSGKMEPRSAGRST